MKRVILFLTCIFLIFVTCACDEDKASILFNNQPITKDNIFNYSFVFPPNQRIYYLVLIPKKIYTDSIEIQIIKKDNQYERLGYNLYWSHSAKLREDQMHYYEDYVVISQTGNYVMKVFSKDNPTKTLCMAQFYIRE